MKKNIIPDIADIKDEFASFGLSGMRRINLSNEYDFMGQPMLSKEELRRQIFKRLPKDDPRVIYEKQLEELRDLGFDDEELCIKFLKETNGNVEEVVDKIVLL